MENLSILITNILLLEYKLVLKEKFLYDGLFTWIPVPLAEAGGFTIHFFLTPSFSNATFNAFISAGRIKVLGIKPNLLKKIVH